MPGVTQMCEWHTVEQWLQLCAENPGLGDFQADPSLDRCCQRDEIAERWGWSVAHRWDWLEMCMGT